MLTAALDAARLGARAPLSADLLRAAAPGYCTSQQQAEAPDNWFEQALAYATGKLHGAAAALSPAGAGMGQVAGYTVADYLIQHASRERRYARVPASTWDAVLSHIRDPADAARLADSARNRLLYRYAIPLYRHAADAGDGDAACGWPTCWPSAATWTELRARADAGDGDAAAAGRAAGRARRPGRAARPGRRRRRACRRRLADLLAERGDLDELRARADAGDQYAASAGRPAGRARRPGRAARPGRRRRRAAACGWPSCWPSAATWTGPRRSCAPGPTPATGCRLSAGRPAGRARRPGRGLRARADAGDGYAAERLADLLAERGDLDGLRARADAGDGPPPAAGWPSC